MAYLHNSDVSVHGKLRSCNCLIDGRFVLKISDFGLSILRTPSECNRDTKYYKSKFFTTARNVSSSLYLLLELLWVAPELLPVTFLPGVPATQKGDVYSFAIILEEIISRGGPYSVDCQTMDIPSI